MSAAVERFLEALWIEDGLAANTLAAYRRDLAAYATWLEREQGLALEATRESDLLAYTAYRHAGSRATSANRRLTVFKRFFRWALRERVVHADPSLRLRNARQALRVPKTPVRGPGRGIAGCARRGRAAGAARSRDARVDVRQRPARQRTGGSQDRAAGTGRRRAARDRQGGQGARLAVRRRGAWLAHALPGRGARRRSSTARPATRCSSPRAARA